MEWEWYLGTLAHVYFNVHLSMDVMMKIGNVGWIYASINGWILK